MTIGVAGNEKARRGGGTGRSRVSPLLHGERIDVGRLADSDLPTVYEYVSAETPEKHSNVLANAALRERVGGEPKKRRSPPRRVSRRAAPAVVGWGWISP
jgi:hypothetical protein